MSLKKLTYSTASGCCTMAPVSLEGPIALLLPFPAFWRLRCFWASDAVCFLAARQEVEWCERPWLCLNILLHPLQATMIIRKDRSCDPWFELRFQTVKFTLLFLSPPLVTLGNSCPPTLRMKALKATRATKGGKADLLTALDHAIKSAKGALHFLKQVLLLIIANTIGTAQWIHTGNLLDSTLGVKMPSSTTVSFWMLQCC